MPRMSVNRTAGGHSILRYADYESLLWRSDDTAALARVTATAPPAAVSASLPASRAPPPVAADMAVSRIRSQLLLCPKIRILASLSRVPGVTGQLSRVPQSPLGP